MTPVVIIIAPPPPPPPPPQINKLTEQLSFETTFIKMDHNIGDN